jgi:hypothetical protein
MNRFDTLVSNLEHPALLEHMLRRVGFFVGAMAIACAAGYWIGSGQTFFLYLWTAGLVLLLVAIGLRERAWILIPLTWYIKGTPGIFAIPFAIRDIGIILATCAYIAYQIISRRATSRHKWHPLDYIVAINAAYLVFTFIHNPVGLLALGGEKMGGRPYVTIALALVAYWVLVRLPQSAKSVGRVPAFVCIGAAVVGVLYMIAYVSPGAASKLSYIYASIDVEAYASSESARSSGLPRYSGLGWAGMILCITLSAYYPPKTLFDPTRKRFYLFMLGIVWLFASGFRNYLLRTMVIVFLSSWFWRGWREILVIFAVAGLVLLAVIQGHGRFYNLPLSAQRTMEWLPGKWSPIVKEDAERSTRARRNWWADVIRYNLIDDWVFGDGFGVSVKEYSAMYMTRMDTFEEVLLVGQLHHGPLTTIRYVGSAGLVLFYALMLTTMTYAVRMTQKCRNTALQPLAIFLAAFFIWYPVHFTFVFGAYSTNAPEVLFYAGLLRLLIRMSEQSQQSVAYTPVSATALTGPIESLPTAS